MANFILQPGEKARNVWVIVWLEDLERLYPENPYGELLSYLSGLHIPCACSPLHTKDTYDEEDVKKWRRRHIDKETGEVAEDCVGSMPNVGDHKKGHAHVYFEFPNPVGREYLSDKVMGELLPIRYNAWERVIHPDTAKRYLCHMDDPDKYRYPITEIHCFGDIKMAALLRPDEFTKINTLIACQNYIEENKVRHYHKLVNWAKRTGDYELISCVAGRASHFVSYFRSISDEKREREEARKAAAESGQVA